MAGCSEINNQLSSTDIVVKNISEESLQGKNEHVNIKTPLTAEITNIHQKLKG